MVLNEFQLNEDPTGVPLQKLTLDEFLDWEAQQADRHEFYDGEVFAMVGAPYRHHLVIQNLMVHLRTHLKGSSCVVVTETMKAQVAKGKGEGILYPDLMVTCGKPLAAGDDIVSDPVLVVEVLSPSTKGYDQRQKFALYRSNPSVREYALIDPATHEVEVFTLTEKGEWLLTDQTAREALTFRSIDCTLPMTQVFEGVEREK
jgi:Uma2 family endonuclease